MKFCSYCGEKLQDDAQVCTACNKTLSPMSAPPINPAPVQQPVQQANPYQAPASHPYQQQTSYQANPYQQQQTSHQSNPYQQQNTAQQQYQANQYQRAAIYSTLQPMDSGVVDKLRNIASSPLLIILASLLTVNLILALIPAFMNFNAGTFIFSILGLTLPILIVIGVWMVFAGKNTIGDRKTAGMTMIQTSVIITFVLLCIAIVIFAISMVVILAAANAYNSYSSYAYGYQSNDASSGIITIFLLLFLILAIPFIYYILLMKAIGSVKKAIGTGENKTNGITGTVVFNFIFALVSLITAIVYFTISASIGYALDSIMMELYYSLPSDIANIILDTVYSFISPTTLALNGIASLVSTGILVVSSILLLNYKKAMNSLK